MTKRLISGMLNLTDSLVPRYKKVLIEFGRYMARGRQDKKMSIKKFVNTVEMLTTYHKVSVFQDTW